MQTTEARTLGGRVRQHTHPVAPDARVGVVGARRHAVRAVVGATRRAVRSVVRRGLDDSTNRIARRRIEPHRVLRERLAADSDSHCARTRRVKRVARVAHTPQPEIPAPVVARGTRVPVGVRDTRDVGRGRPRASETEVVRGHHVRNRVDVRRVRLSDRVAVRDVGRQQHAAVRHRCEAGRARTRLRLRVLGRSEVHAETNVGHQETVRRGRERCVGRVLVLEGVRERNIRRHVASRALATRSVTQRGGVALRPIEHVATI